MEINRPTHTHTGVYVCRHVRDYRIQILTNIMPLDTETHTQIYIYVVYVCILDNYTHITEVHVSLIKCNFPKMHLFPSESFS